MVCSLGSGRMAVMARLLTGESVPKKMTEKVAKQNLAAQYILRQFREADEANLLDEEEMLVFGLKPMTDSLHLVSCNACKKPVKASQYASHAELCKSLSSVPETIPQLDWGLGQKKPPRKAKKKLSTSHAGNSLCVNGAPLMDVSEVNPGSTYRSASGMPPPIKRSKSRTTAEGQLKSDHLETASGFKPSLCRRTQEAPNFREYPKGSSARSKKSDNDDVGYQSQMRNQVCGYSFLVKDIPVPLASKIFYSQRNHRLRSAIRHLYHDASAKEYWNYMINPTVVEENASPSFTSSPQVLPHEQTENQQEKTDKQSFPLQKFEQSLQNSEVYLGTGCCPPMNFQYHSPANDFLRPQPDPVGLITKKIISDAYSSTSNSGKALRTV